MKICIARILRNLCMHHTNECIGGNDGNDADGKRQQWRWRRRQQQQHSQQMSWQCSFYTIHITELKYYNTETRWMGTAAANDEMNMHCEWTVKRQSDGVGQQKISEKGN